MFVFVFLNNSTCINRQIHNCKCLWFFMLWVLNLCHSISVINIEYSQCLNMFRHCCIPKCNSLRNDVKLHRFPVKQERRIWWQKCINCRCVTQSDVSKLYVCHKHFEKKFINITTNRLKLGAYPTLFTALDIASGKPTTFYPQTGNLISLSLNQNLFFLH